MEEALALKPSSVSRGLYRLILALLLHFLPMLTLHAAREWKDSDKTKENTEFLLLKKKRTNLCTQVTLFMCLISERLITVLSEGVCVRWRTLYAGTAGATSEISVLACGWVCGLRWTCGCLCVNMRRGGWFSFGPRNPGADLHLEQQMNKIIYRVGKSAVLTSPGNWAWRIFLTNHM